MTRRQERIHRAVDQIIRLERSGQSQSDTLRRALQLTSEIQLAERLDGLDWALARVSNSLGKLCRELGEPSIVSAAHHIRAFRLARQINDPTLAFDALLNIAHCYEVDFPGISDRALRAAYDIATWSLVGPHDHEWALINIYLRKGQLFQMQGLSSDKTSLYRNIILPRMVSASHVDIDSYAIGLVGFAEHMISIRGYDVAWSALHEPAVSEVANQRALVDYQVALLRGRVYALVGQVAAAERELLYADRLRLLNQLAPNLAYRLVAAIAAAQGR